MVGFYKKMPIWGKVLFWLAVVSVVVVGSVALFVWGVTGFGENLFNDLGGK